jgi:hypothetical protein
MLLITEYPLIIVTLIVGLASAKPHCWSVIDYDGIIDAEFELLSTKV